MIRRTRLKFFAVTAAIIVGMLTAFCSILLASVYSADAQNAREILEWAIDDYSAQNTPGSRPPPGAFGDARSFAVRLSATGEITGIRSSPLFSEDEIRGYVSEILGTNKSDGKSGDLIFLIKETPNGKFLAATDVSIETAAFSLLLFTVLLAGGGSAAALLLLAWCLSYWIVRPAAQSLEKQKRFISEAGHELKTPLTVISAGIDLMQKSGGDAAENEKWLKNIKEQTEKMSALTKELLTLSKIDEDLAAVKTDFDLSETLLGEVLSFESLAFERGKKIACDIAEGVRYKGDPASVRKIAGILCDNAIKYSDESSTVSVSFTCSGRGAGVFSVTNAGFLSKEEIPVLFERFYRGSESRADEPGSGLGLSILKTLCEKNGWKADVETTERTVTFKITF